MRVSIITVCYNSESTIERTIKSVIGQTYKNIEYILVDGKSSDGTVDIIKEYKKKYPVIINYVSEPDRGIYDAMNKGISMTSGELIGIVNSDDYYELDAVDNIVKSMTDDKYQILYGYLRKIKNNEEYSVSRLSYKFLEENMIAHPTCFVTKSVYDNFGTYNTEYVSVADYEFMLRMYKNKMVKFIPTDYVISNFEMGGMSATNDAWLDLLKLKMNMGYIPKSRYYRELNINKLYTVKEKTANWIKKHLNHTC